MCVVSAIMDDWNRRQQTAPMSPNWYPPMGTFTYNPNPITREEFEELRKEVLELKQLLLAAKKYDKATGQPDCESEDKAALIRKLAELVGVDISDIFTFEDKD